MSEEIDYPLRERIAMLTAPGMTLRDLALLAEESDYRVKSAIVGEIEPNRFRVLVLPYRSNSEIEDMRVIGDVQAFINDHVPLTIMVEARKWAGERREEG